MVDNFASVLEYFALFILNHGSFFKFILRHEQVFPAIRKYAKEHGASGLVPVVVSTCNIAESMCTHYVVSFLLPGPIFGLNIIF